MENLDDNLDSPLLGDNNDSSNNNGITLNGDSIDLRDLLLGGSVGGVGLDGHESSGNSAAAAFGRVNHENSDCNSNNEGGGNSVEEEKTPALPAGCYTTEEEGPTSSGTLSLDDNRSSFTDRSNKKSSKSIRLGGQIMYYKARRQLSNIVSYLTTKATASSDGENNYISSNSMSNNQGHDGRNRQRILTQKSSLSSSKTTPSILKLLIPPFLIINHILFLQGQTQPMWNLAYKTNITITATATTLKSKAAYDTLNLPHDYTFEHQEMKIVETFTYMDAIRKLWKGDGLGDAQTLSKVAAALLILFSGIWPHLKLVLVHICWFVPFVHRLFLTRGARNDDDDEQHQNEYYGSSERHLCCKSKNESTGNNNLCCSNGHFHNTSNRRSPFLRVLSTLGKWSLADILVVCILIAVLHLDWKVNPYEIRSGVENELPKIIEYVKVKYPDVNGNCEQLLGYYCEMGKALVIHYPQCLACKTLISNAYTHPEWATSEGKDIMEGIDLGGGGYAQLRVMGMVGTYYFCASVIMSILLSLVVDMYDERDRQRVEEDLMDRKSELEFILPGEEGYGGNEEEHYDLQLNEEEGPSSSPHHQPPPSNLFHQGHHRFASSTTPSGPARRPVYRVTNSFHYATDNTGLRPPIPKPTTNSRLLKHVIMSLLSIISLPFVCYAVTLPTMQRLVFGGGPALIHEVVGMVWEQEYSLITLVKTTGDAGGWDTFLMLTFGMFVVVGPILRAVCLTLNACLGIPVALLQDCIERPRHRTTVRLALYQATTQLQRALRPAIDCLGAFCSWEVLIVALIMIQLEMPSITDTIYQDDKCQEADPEHGRTCIEVQFNALDTFLVVVVSFFILTGASAFAMTLASSEDEQPLLNDEGEKRYEYGQPIPQRQAAFMRNDHVNSGYNNDDEPLEQIVFI